MISVSDALEKILALVAPTGTESVPLREARGRVMAAPHVAAYDQPPFSASAMDGYAVIGSEAREGARFRAIGESAAGHGHAGAVAAGEAVRIFTGAPMPRGADRVIIQEDVARDGDIITVTAPQESGPHVRPAAADFAKGAEAFPRRRLGPADLALLAAMDADRLVLHRRPEVALIATGDELVMPGTSRRPGQIAASNSFGLAAMVEAAGGIARLLPIARDDIDALAQSFELARGADLIVTIGGASVGDHDLVGRAAALGGMEQAFYKVAMRPGKPLMAGRLGTAAMIGLPGNPVSAMVCGHVFLRPALDALLGLPAGPAPRRTAPLACDLPANGPREHYLRARLGIDGITPFPTQDSSLLSVLAEADALLVRPVGDPARRVGETVDYLPLGGPGGG
ncbi:molybdopterin molybdenumtransferase MoeA [Mesobaculum littorinae]|uniref:Molybdopterin molybdenumtransferase n=1 Tax=Mesobaculum littorinae TaxID=2486419 RepID=A0A438AKZ7_9RHOB|nr:molybdopterin molybdotransferase MoeA [Mesobaculum littorinae]RVV99276.1 molybdopterin molybdenumtransferase MoeA [Mesobaculum littorinae]